MRPQLSFHCLTWRTTLKTLIVDIQIYEEEKKHIADVEVLKEVDVEVIKLSSSS